MRGLQAARSVSLPMLRTSSRSFHIRIATIPQPTNTVRRAVGALARAPAAGFVPRGVPVVGLRAVLGRRYQSGATAAA